MTSLRTFQTEIDEISHREVAKQRAHATAERAKVEKEAAAKRNPTSKSAPHPHARKQSTEAGIEANIPAKEPIAATPTVAGNGNAAASSDIDEQLQVRSRPSRCDSFPPSSGSQRVCMLT